MLVGSALLFRGYQLLAGLAVCRSRALDHLPHADLCIGLFQRLLLRLRQFPHGYRASGFVPHGCPPVFAATCARPLPARRAFLSHGPGFGGAHRRERVCRLLRFVPADRHRYFCPNGNAPFHHSGSSRRSCPARRGLPAPHGLFPARDRARPHGVDPRRQFSHLLFSASRFFPLSFSPTRPPAIFPPASAIASSWDASARFSNPAPSSCTFRSTMTSRVSTISSGAASRSMLLTDESGPILSAPGSSPPRWMEATNCRPLRNIRFPPKPRLAPSTTAFSWSRWAKTSSFSLRSHDVSPGNYRLVSIDTGGAVYNLDLDHPINRYEADSELPEVDAEQVRLAPDGAAPGIPAISDNCRRSTFASSSSPNKSRPRLRITTIRLSPLSNTCARTSATHYSCLEPRQQIHLPIFCSKEDRVTANISPVPWRSCCAQSGSRPAS